MFVAMVVFHTLVCILLMIVVLMQSAKGEGLAGAFGGGGGSGLTGAVFGGRGAASFLSKATTVLAVLFMVNCGILAFMSSHRSGRTSGSAVSESAVTQQAQEEMERQAAQQQAVPMDQPIDAGEGSGDADLPAVPAEEGAGN